jgi:ribokinase
VLILQLEIPIDTVVAAARAASDAGVTVLLNPSPVRDLPSELVAAVTVLVVNRGEADALGVDVLGAVPHVVTTLGGDGAVHRGPDGVETAVPAPAVDVVDTTGAGDAFDAGVLVAWTGGASPAEALAAGVAAGTRAVGAAGAWPF